MINLRKRTCFILFFVIFLIYVLFFKSSHLKIAIVVVITNDTNPNDYEIALNSLQCYSRIQKYHFIIAIDTDYPCYSKDKFFRRHCVVTHILPKFDAVLFLDADMGVVNPKRRIEEFLEDDIDVSFLDRFFNCEIMTGSYLIRNTPYSLELLQGFVDYEHNLPNSFHGTDNGAIHMYLAQLLFPHAHVELENCQKLYNKSKNFADLFIYEACIRTIFGAGTKFGKVRIWRKAEGWVRDAWLTSGMWDREKDFMMHGWKMKQLVEVPENGVSPIRMNYNIWYNPLSGPINLSKCTPSNQTWSYDPRLIGTQQMQGILEEYRKIVAREVLQNGPFLGGLDSEAGYSDVEEKKLKIAIVVVVTKGTNSKDYEIALESVECYARIQDYNFILAIDSDYPCPHKDKFFRRHCVVTHILPKFDAVLFIDADIGVVNPKRRIEEFLEDDIDVSFYDRFFNCEIMAGSYLIRNTPYALELLKGWADYEFKLPNSFHGTDNGAIHMYLAQLLFPHAHVELENCQKLYNKSKNFADLFIYEACIRTIFGAGTKFGKVRIWRKAEGWVRDAWLTSGMWDREKDFMMHGWKMKQLRKVPKKGVSPTRLSNYNIWYNPLSGPINLSKCTPSNQTWSYDPRLVGNPQKILESLEEYRKIVAKDLFENGYKKMNI